MTKIIMEKECGCFRKSSYKSIQEFNTNEQALEVAKTMCEDMNENFCHKHKFAYINNEDEIIIKMEINK